MRILLVDDDPLILRAYTRLLNRRGYEVKARWDHNQAIIDAMMWAEVALVDVDMPERTGPELVRAFPENLPVVFYTGNPSAVPKGARVLEKPASVDEILAALEDAVAGVVR